MKSQLSVLMGHDRIDEIVARLLDKSLGRDEAVKLLNEVAVDLTMTKATIGVAMCTFLETVGNGRDLRRLKDGCNQLAADMAGAMGNPLPPPPVDIDADEPGDVEVVWRPDEEHRL